jgi:drug/metabolite transporter (DMT)-like permease
VRSLASLIEWVWSVCKGNAKLLIGARNDTDLRRRAVLCMVASALCLSLMNLLAKEVGRRIPVAEIVFARGVLGVLLSLWLLKQAGVSPWGRRRGLLVWRGLASTGALFAIYGDLTTLPLETATVLQYLYPTFTALLAWIGLREQISKRLIVAITVGWLGVVFVSQPAFLFGGSTALPLMPVLIGVSGALFSAIAYVGVRSLANSEHPLVVVLYFPLVSLPISIPFVLMHPVLPTNVEWLMLLGVGLFSQFAQVFLTLGFKVLPAARATSISYVQVFFAGLWGWMFLEETINQWNFIGVLMVMMATLISLSGSKRALSDVSRPSTR